ncbi:IclR family transcriptional regulator domain-containing protein [Comamonas sp. 4034]|uniref:IclR family transcriptional regulator domain-containing protein n=1 Tax=Comamonas sp. 4034 TaxID=3156455 RepID=UPI003D21F822
MIWDRKVFACAIVFLPAWELNAASSVATSLNHSSTIHTNIRTGTVMSLAGTATGRLFAAYLPAKLIEESLLEDERRLGPDIAASIDRDELQTVVSEIRKHGTSRTINNPTPGVSSFAAPVFDYSGNIVLGITLMGRTRSFDTDWEGKEAAAAKACSEEVSRRLGHHRASVLFR